MRRTPCFQSSEMPNVIRPMPSADMPTPPLGLHTGLAQHDDVVFRRLDARVVLDALIHVDLLAVDVMTTMTLSTIARVRPYKKLIRWI